MQLVMQSSLHVKVIVLGSISLLVAVRLAHLTNPAVWEFLKLVHREKGPETLQKQGCSREKVNTQVMEVSYPLGGS